jgi:hypothetical protein
MVAKQMHVDVQELLISSPIRINLMWVMDDLKMGFVNVAHRHYQTRIWIGKLQVSLEASN